MREDSFMEGLSSLLKTTFSETISKRPKVFLVGVDIL